MSQHSTNSKPKRVRPDTAKEYAALCFRVVPGAESPLEIMLILCPNTGRWVLPKSSGVSQTKAYEIVQREACSEAGIRGRIRKKPCGYYTYTEKDPEDRNVVFVVQVHLVLVLELDRELSRKSSTDLRWLSPIAAASAIFEPELRRIVTCVQESALQFAYALS